jgi:hypothetical protein
VVRLERAKIGKEPFKNVLQLLQLLINMNRNAVLQRKGMEIVMFLPKAAGKFCLLSYWLVAIIWAFPRGFPIPFKNFPEAGQ